MPKPNALHVYKASAGSGKTWRLAVEYVKYLLTAPTTYRDILAVTFTNKAAGEMKQRVLDYLLDLSRIPENEAPLPGKIASVVEAVQRELGPEATRPWIKSRASKALGYILHDYTHFRIQTIDTFFQEVLRQLARELGLGSQFNIDLDHSRVLKQAVTNVLENSATDPETYGWLRSFMEEQLEEGRLSRFADILVKFGNLLFSEAFQEKEKDLREALSVDGFMESYRRDLSKAKKQAEENLKDRFDPLAEEYRAMKVDPKNISYSSTRLKYFLDIGAGDYTAEPKTNFLKAAEDPLEWLTKANQTDHALLAMASALTDLARRFLQAREDSKEDLRVLDTVKSIQEHLFETGLLAGIAAEVQRLNREENRFLLGDTASFLATMSEGGDASFVFEKIGSYLQHILIDEFQDTSRLQWRNFKPLIDECLANGRANLVVGDEKQSIYRFRNGDWRILGGIGREFREDQVEEIPLDRNFRSSRRVVEFNNTLFEQAVETALTQLKNHIEVDTLGQDRCDQVKRAYAQVCQHCPEGKPDEGLVRVEFLSDDKKAGHDYKTDTLDRLFRLVEEYQENGVPAEDIAILVRVNRDASRIADYFSREALERGKEGLCYRIVSDEAFRLDASSGLMTLVSALRVVANPDSGLLRYELGRWLKQEKETKALQAQSKELARLPLRELARRLADTYVPDKRGQEAYFFSFFDYLDAFVEKQSSDISEFLAYWDETLCAKTIPMGSSIKGIRILTVHKAKGLEFPTVLLPFCDWKLQEDEKRAALWCAPRVAPFDRLPLVRVKCSKDLKNSYLAEDYLDESVQMLVDGLNTFYVATTRAVNHLVVLTKTPPKTNDAVPSVSTLLSALFSHQVVDGVYQVGELVARAGESASKTSERTAVKVEYRAAGRHIGFRQSRRSQDFLRDKTPFTTRFIEEGKLKHYLFEKIRYRADVPSAVAGLVGEGLLPAAEAPAWEAQVAEWLSDPRVAAWFEPGGDVFNERNLLTMTPEGDLQEFRPDRVIRHGDTLQVVDFKFGQNEEAEHLSQVRHYMSLLRDMGHPSVEGYLWYVEKSRIIAVNA